jgi:hypothetical protein
MAKDVGVVDGPKPVCFMGRPEDMMRLFGEPTQGSAIAKDSTSNIFIEFGAEQAILVRNDKDAAFLRSKIGDTALILRIEQSKGTSYKSIFGRHDVLH